MGRLVYISAIGRWLSSGSSGQLGRLPNICLPRGAPACCPAPYRTADTAPHAPHRKRYTEGVVPQALHCIALPSSID